MLSMGVAACSGQPQTQGSSTSGSSSTLVSWTTATSPPSSFPDGAPFGYCSAKLGPVPAPDVADAGAVGQCPPPYECYGGSGSWRCCASGNPGPLFCMSVPTDAGAGDSAVVDSGCGAPDAGPQFTCPL